MGLLSSIEKSGAIKDVTIKTGRGEPRPVKAGREVASIVAIS